MAALHIREHALVAITTLLTGLITTGANVTRGRVYSIDEADLPHLSIVQGNEDPIIPDNEDEAVFIHAYYSVEVKVQITINASSGVLETILNLICKEISDAINVDTTLGVNGVVDTIELGTSQLENTGEKEKRTAQAEMLWVIRYRRLRSDATST